MSRAATERLKVNAPVGVKPALRWLRLDEMFVDYSYQRSLDEPKSQALIRQIAVFWDWGLCQPLTVAKRPNGALMIVDGQHRHAAARLRGDIETLPCVVATFQGSGDEAAAFVALNRNRRPLTALDLFKAALTANDPEAVTVLRAIEDAGLKLSNHASTHLMKPNHICNIGGLLRCYRQGGGEAVLRVALTALANAYRDEVLRYAGTIFPGLAAVALDELRLRSPHDEIVEHLSRIAAARSQSEWRKIIKRAVGESGGMAREAAALVFRRVWSERHQTKAIVPPSTAKPARTFDEQLAAVERGEVGIGRAFRPKKALPDRTLGGVGSGMV